MKQYETGNCDLNTEAMSCGNSPPLPDLSEEDYAVWVYTGGSSPLLPAMHAILGLRKLDGISGPLQEHWQMQGTAARRHGMPVFQKTAEVSNRVKHVKRFVDGICCTCLTVPLSACVH